MAGGVLRRITGYIPDSMAPLALLLPASLSTFVGGYWIVVDRVSLRVSPFNEPLALAALAVSVAGALAVSSSLSRGGDAVASVISRLVAGVVLVEIVSAASITLMLVARTLVPGHYNLLFSIVIVERSLWLGLTFLAPIALPLSIAYYTYRAAGGKPRPGGSSSSVAGAGTVYLALALAVAALSVIVPHTRAVNPRGLVVSTDTAFNVEWIRLYLERGFYGGIADTMPLLRPAYMAFLFSFYEAVGGSPEAFADVILPGLGFILLVLSTYWLAKALPGSIPGLASLISILYWAPAFVYGGFQTNLYALSIAMVASRLLLEGRYKPFTAVSTLLGFWHPWTLTYYTVAWLLYLLLESRALSGASSAIRALTIVAPLAATIAVDSILLLLLTGSYEAIGNIVKPALPRVLPTAFYDALFVHVWGTMARPEVLLAAALAALNPRIPPGAVALSAPSTAFLLLNPSSGYRLLLEAPYPILAHYAYKRAPALAIAPAVSWLYLIANSVYK